MGQKAKGSWILVGIILLGIIGSYFLGGRLASKIIPNDTIYVIDSAWIAVPVEVPKPYEVIIHDTIYIYDSIKFEVPIPTDTAAILADYTRHFVYNDTLYYPDLTLAIKEVIYKNRIDHREVSYQNLRETQIITNELNGWFIGADLSLNSVTPELSYVRRGWEYSLGYELNFNQNHSVSIGLKKKL